MGQRFFFPIVVEDSTHPQLLPMWHSNAEPPAAYWAGSFIGAGPQAASFWRQKLFYI